MLTADQRQRRAKVASLTARASKSPDDPGLKTELDEARRDYYAEAIASYVQRIAAQAPPFTAEQRQRLAVLLDGGPA